MDAPSGLDWKRGGVVLDLGAKGEFDDRGIESPTVVREAPDRLVMWYRGQQSSDKVGRIGRSVSKDGLHWKRTGIVMVPKGSLEAKKIDPMTVIVEDGVYKMWYGGGGKGGCALLATSMDGIEWERSGENPVLRKTRGSWDNRGAGGQHSVIRVGDRYQMFYKGFGSDDEGWAFYGLADSRDGERWTKLGKRISPDLEIGETPKFRNLFALYRDGSYYLLHAMAGTDRLSLRLLRSDDAKSWEHAGLVFARGRTPGGTDVKWSTSPTLLIENGRVRMWYEGGDENGRVRIHYAETSADAFFAHADRFRPSLASSAPR